jgi:hypothetical protein
MKPSEEGVQILKQIMLWLATEANALDVVDAVGAYPIHALLVCNTEDSVDLSMRIFDRVPAMVTRVHRAPKAPFLYDGESSLHILAVNHREDEFVRLVELATSSLLDAEVSPLHLSAVLQYGKLP